MKNYIYLLLLCLIASCSADSDNSQSPSDAGNASSDGQGGSLAKFTLKGDYLYTVDYNELNVYDVTDIENPTIVNSEFIGFDIETLFSYKEYLYVGSQRGMFIYSIENPEFPKELASVQHFTACDPVIANDTTAFVTLHSDTFCGNEINVLEIYDVTEIEKPVLLSTRNLVAPKGIGLYENYLFVCDDEIKIFDVSNPKDSKFVKSINREAFDVIIQGNYVIAIGENGVYQYELSIDDTKKIALKQLSEIVI